MRGLAEELRRRELPLLGLDVLPEHFNDPRYRYAFETRLEPCERFVREEFGACFLVVLRRTQDGVDVKHGPAWEEH